MLQRVEEESLDELDESVNADGAMQPLQDKRRGNVKVYCVRLYSKDTHDMHNNNK